MGMFSEIAEEMEEKAYKKGFIEGMLWPIFLPIMAIKAIGQYLYRRRIDKLLAQYEKDKRERRYDYEYMPTKKKGMSLAEDLQIQRRELTMEDLEKMEQQSVAVD